MGADAVAGGALEKNLRIPSFLVNCRSVSTSDGTSDSSEESSELMLVVVEFVVEIILVDVLSGCHGGKEVEA